MLWKGTWKCGGVCINGVVGDTSMQHGIMPYLYGSVARYGTPLW